MERKVEPRDGFEVYISKANNICIKQVNLLDGETVIIIHPDDVTKLIEFLQDAHQETLANEYAPPTLNPYRQESDEPVS
jgi:hypothetical protein